MVPRQSFVKIFLPMSMIQKQNFKSVSVSEQDITTPMWCGDFTGANGQLHFSLVWIKSYFISPYLDHCYTQTSVMASSVHFYELFSAGSEALLNV